MKTGISAALLSLLTLSTSLSPAFASTQAPMEMIEVGTAEEIVLLVEETESGVPGQSFIASAEIENDSMINPAGSIKASVLPLFVSLGGQLGIAVGGGILEVGVESNLWLVAAGPQGAAATTLGGYARVGKQVFIEGRAYRVFGFNQAVVPIHGVGLSVGAEIGEGTYLALTGENLFMGNESVLIPMLTIGQRF